MKPALIHVENLTLNMHPAAVTHATSGDAVLSQIIRGAAVASLAERVRKHAPSIEVPEGTVIHPATGLMHAINNPFGDKRFTFAEAQKACTELRVGGFTDWRAPTLKELFAMADHTRFKPAVNPDEYPDITSDWYWTSTVDPESPSAYAFGVYFSYGTAGFGSQYGRGRVLAVRSVVASASQ